MALPKGPRGLVLAQPSLVRRRQVTWRILVRIDARAFRRARLEGGHARRVCLAGIDDALHARDIDRAPDAAAATRREPLRPQLVVDAVADAVDPAECEADLHRVRVADRRLGDTLAIEPDPRLARGAVVRLDPPSQASGRTVADHLLAFRPLHHPPSSRTRRCRTRPATVLR